MALLLLFWFLRLMAVMKLIQPMAFRKIIAVDYESQMKPTNSFSGRNAAFQFYHKRHMITMPIK
jgi:hypothetical protein